MCIDYIEITRNSYQAFRDCGVSAQFPNCLLSESRWKTEWEPLSGSAI